MLVGALSLCIMPARPRVQRAPGLPRALFTFGGQTKCKTSGDQRREKARCCHTRPGRLARLDRACQRLRRRDLRAPLRLRPRQAALTAAYATVRFSMILRKSVAR